MKTPDPNCRVCKGLGYFRGYTYGDFGPQLDYYPCPDCNPVGPISRWAIAAVVAIFGLFVAFLALGAR